MDVWTVFTWWLVLGYAPSACGAILLWAHLRRYQGRHHGRYTVASTAPRGHARVRHRLTDELRLAPTAVSTPAEILAARERIERRARAAESFFGPRAELPRPVATATLYGAPREPDPVSAAPELSRYESAAGTAAYLRITPRGGDGAALVYPEERRAQLDARTTTDEMYLQFGHALGPVVGPQAQADEWIEEGGRHGARGRATDHARVGRARDMAGDRQRSGERDPAQGSLAPTGRG
jgi:hypothetical protein